MRESVQTQEHMYFIISSDEELNSLIGYLVQSNENYTVDIAAKEPVQ